MSLVERQHGYSREQKVLSIEGKGKVIRGI